MLYQSSDNKKIIKGDRTAKSFKPDSAVMNTPKMKKGGGCGCGK